MSMIVGLDVGGAHLKVAVLENDRFTSAQQYLCPLWQGTDQLDQALKQTHSLTSQADHIAITMTGELSDLFETRKQGVVALVNHLDKEFGDQARYWMARHGFGTAQEAKQHHHDVGSTNFLATAQAVSKHAPSSVLIDMGSTTTDIVPIQNGKPVPNGLTDAQRLQSGELIYTGLTRTPVMAITQRVPFQGQWQSLAREHLATMADVHRLLGNLTDGDDLHDTADGRGKSPEECLARLARMMGLDSAELSQSGPSDLAPATPAWKPAAKYIEREQLKSIEDGVLQVLSAHPNLKNPTIITAGIGHHIGLKIAKALDAKCRSFSNLLGGPPNLDHALTSNAPAAAVALLIGQDV